MFSQSTTRKFPGTRDEKRELQHVLKVETVMEIITEALQATARDMCLGAADEMRTALPDFKRGVGGGAMDAFLIAMGAILLAIMMRGMGRISYKPAPSKVAPGKIIEINPASPSTAPAPTRRAASFMYPSFQSHDENFDWEDFQNRTEKEFLEVPYLTDYEPGKPTAFYPDIVPILGTTETRVSPRGASRCCIHAHRAAADSSRGAAGFLERNGLQTLDNVARFPRNDVSRKN